MSIYHQGFSAPLPQEEFLKRKKFLERVIRQLEQRLADAPEGSLVVTRKKTGAPGYYHVLPGGKERVYLNKANRQRIAQLAQKEYDKKALQVAKRELASVEAVLRYCELDKVEDVLSLCQKEKREYIAPVVEPDEAFRDRWLRQNYVQKKPNDDDTLYPTEKGDLVRSKSEGMQANYMFHHDHDYLYEKRITLYDRGRKVYRYPDFTILDPVTRQEVIFEHFGMVDNDAYLRDNLEKLRLYLENGYVIGENLLFTYETRDHPFTMDQFIRVLEARFGKRKP